MGSPDGHDEAERVSEKGSAIEPPPSIYPRPKRDSLPEVRVTPLIFSIVITATWPMLLFFITFTVAAITKNLFIGYYMVIALAISAPFMGAWAFRRPLLRMLYFLIDASLIYLWFHFGTGNIFS